MMVRENASVPRVDPVGAPRLPQPVPGRPADNRASVPRLEAPFEFIDTHCHFWDPGRLSYPWLAGVPSIAGAHTPAVLGAEAGIHMPEQVVFVQAGCDSGFDEALWVEDLARHQPRITAIVAATAIDRGAETVAALEVLCRRPLLRGIRHLIQDQDDPGFCLRPAFVAGVRQLGQVGLSFDLCIRHHQLRSVTELCRLCPETTFVLDHAGKPDVRNAWLDPWRDDIARLAMLENVTCKLSGLIAEADPASWTPGDLGPYVDRILACFGPKRVLFGSDWPVVKIGSSYVGWLDTARNLLSDLSSTDRAAVFCDNARRIYRLNERSRS